MAVLYKCFLDCLQSNHGRPYTLHPIKGVSYEQVGGYIECFIKEWIEDIA